MTDERMLNPTVQAVAATLRWSAYALTVDGLTTDDLNQIAEQVSYGWDGIACPMCEETVCDTDCPLEHVRREQP